MIGCPPRFQHKNPSVILRVQSGNHVWRWCVVSAGCRQTSSWVLGNFQIQTLRCLQRHFCCAENARSCNQPVRRQLGMGSSWMWSNLDSSIVKVRVQYFVGPLQKDKSPCSVCLVYTKIKVLVQFFVWPVRKQKSFFKVLAGLFKDQAVVCSKMRTVSSNSKPWPWSWVSISWWPSFGLLLWAPGAPLLCWHWEQHILALDTTGNHWMALAFPLFCFGSGCSIGGGTGNSSMSDSPSDLQHFFAFDGC